MATDKWRDVYEVIKHAAESGITGEQEVMLQKCTKANLVDGIIEYVQAAYRSQCMKSWSINEISNSSKSATL